MNNYEFYKDIIEKHLMDYVPSVSPNVCTLYEAMQYSVRSGGKRIRPVLLLASCDFAGGDIYEALPFACAIEYIHTYSLIHDDLPAMDNDDLRRGNPTNHKVFGEAMAILAGDGLLNTAHELLIRNLTYHFDNPEKLKNHIRAALYISKSAGINGMIAGQVADIEGENSDCSKEMLDFIDSNKTGALLSAPIIAGMYIAGASAEMMTDFLRYSELIGRAFQIADDILDATGDEAVVGKKTGKDADLGKCNYVAVLGLEEARKELHRLTIEAQELMTKYGDKAGFFVDLAAKLEGRNS